jgi:hypothetical protein
VSKELGDALDMATAHLALTPDTHWHIVLALPQPDPGEMLATSTISAPYGNEEAAQGDARKSRELVLGTIRHYAMGVLSCQHACPRSSLGDCGWPDEPAPR